MRQNLSVSGWISRLFKWDSREVCSFLPFYQLLPPGVGTAILGRSPSIRSYRELDMAEADIKTGVGILLNLEKGENPTICDNMSDPGRPDVK